MSRWWLAVVALSTGCTAQRYLALPPAAPLGVSMAAPLPGQTWQVGEVTTRVEVGSQQGGLVGTSPPNIDTDQLKKQLTERVRSTLMAQPQLGVVEGPATYALEVEVTARETYGTGKGLALGLALETGILLVGAGLGAAVGAVSDSRANQTCCGAISGMSFGLLAATPAALLAAFVTQSGGVHGEYLATLTLRRRADRIPVATRHLSSSWKADYNLFGIEKKLATFSGNAVPEFERVIVEGVKSMLLEVNEPLATVR